MKLDIFNIDNFIKENNCKEVTSHFTLDSTGGPDQSGLFSTEIFGRMGSEERKINFAYINLKRKFLHPFIYNVLVRMYTKLPQLIGGEIYVKLGKGNAIEVVDDPSKGSTGLDFIIDNWSKINWNAIGSNTRIKKERLLSKLKTNEIFIDKFLVIPAWYRDVNLHSQKSGKISIDDINGLYIKILISSNTDAITFTNSYFTQSTMQNNLVELHNMFTKKIAGKHGIIRQAIMGKSIDYSAIAVISAPKFVSNSPYNQVVPFGYIGIPLYLACSLYMPFYIKWLEDFFYPFEHDTVVQLKGNKYIEVDDIIFKGLSSESIQKMLKAYITDKTKKIRSMQLMINGKPFSKLFEGSPLKIALQREPTLTDLLMLASGDVLRDKHTLSSRYPISGAESIIVNKVRVLTTEETMDIRKIVSKEGKDITSKVAYLDYYPLFPVDKEGNVIHNKIKWSDSVVPNNAFLDGMGGDYDGFWVEIRVLPFYK